MNGDDTTWMNQQSSQWETTERMTGLGEGRREGRKNMRI